MVLKMNCMTRFCVLIAFLVAATEAIAQKRSAQEEPILAALHNLMTVTLLTRQGREGIFWNHNSFVLASFGMQWIITEYKHKISILPFLTNLTIFTELSVGVMQTQRYPISLRADATLAASGGPLANASQKVIYYSTNYNLDYSAARVYCESRGTSIATIDDLKAAFYDGYQKCGCGWVANGMSYVVMQEAIDVCLSSIGVVRCTWQSKWDVFCKYPIPVFISKDPSGNYMMTLAQARKHCEDKGTSLATLEDLRTAFSLGYNLCNCGWVTSGSAYVVMQHPEEECLMGIGIIKCTWQSTWNAFCKVKA